MTTAIAGSVGGHDVAQCITPPILTGDEVLRRALVGLATFGLKAQLGGGSQPHRQVTVIAATGLGLERVGAK